MAVRNIVKIDEEKCNGCGLCVEACAEGAIEIVNGKARLVSDIYCDGLGACIGECPQGAITIEVREAEEFDAAEAHRRMEHMASGRKQSRSESHFTCPGSAVRTIDRATPQTATSGASTPSALGNWPIQLRLVPPIAPYFEEADLLLAADCVPFAYADFHRILEGKVLLIGCPKLDDAEFYVEKLAGIIGRNSIRTVSVLRMEVPCCRGLMLIASRAIERSGKDIPLTELVIPIGGEERSDQ